MSKGTTKLLRSMQAYAPITGIQADEMLKPSGYPFPVKLKNQRQKRKQKRSNPNS